MKFTSQVFKAPKTSPDKPTRVKDAKKMTYFHNLAKPNDVFQTWAWIWDKFWWKMVQSVSRLQGVCKVADIASVAEPDESRLLPKPHSFALLRSSCHYLFNQQHAHQIISGKFVNQYLKWFCYCWLSDCFVQVRHDGCMCSGTISILLWNFPGLWTVGGLLPIKAALIHTAGTNSPAARTCRLYRCRPQRNADALVLIWSKGWWSLHEGNEWNRRWTGDSRMRVLSCSRKQSLSILTLTLMGMLKKRRRLNF